MICKPYHQQQCQHNGFIDELDEGIFDLDDTASSSTHLSPAALHEDASAKQLSVGGW